MTRVCAGVLFAAVLTTGCLFEGEDALGTIPEAGRCETGESPVVVPAPRLGGGLPAEVLPSGDPPAGGGPGRDAPRLGPVELFSKREGRVALEVGILRPTLGRPVFPLSETPHLRFLVVVRNARGPQRLVARFAGPEGLAYSQQKTEFQAEGVETRLEVGLPIAGTMVEQRRLAGDWRASFAVGDVERTVFFELR